MTLALLGVLAVGSLLASDLPRAWAWACAPLVLAYAGWMARQEWRRPRRSLVLPLPGVGGEGDSPGGRMREGTRGLGRAPIPAAEPACGGADLEAPPEVFPLLDDVPLSRIQVLWRGRAAFLHCRDDQGRRHRLVLWPDVTTSQARRELRLALRDRATSPSRTSMAP